MRGHLRTPLLSILLAGLLPQSAGLAAPPRQAAAPRVQAAATRADVVALLDQVQKHQADLDASYAATRKAAAELVGVCQGLSGLVDDALKLAGRGDPSRSGQGGPVEQAAAAKRIREVQASFNLQYLMLQNRISHENRQFSMISGIMKNKHDTAKNSIKNVR